MHDRIDHYGMNDEAALAAALRALPDEAPPVAAWDRLVARRHRRGTTRRILWTGLPAAFAAAIALALAWPHLQLATHAHSPAPIARASADRVDLAALRATSGQWQAWVATLSRDGAPLDGPALAKAVALQDRIGLVDLQLSAARQPVGTAQLWQQRITLLQQLGLVYLQPYAVAREGQPHSAPTIL